MAKKYTAILAPDIGVSFKMATEILGRQNFRGQPFVLELLLVGESCFQAVQRNRDVARSNHAKRKAQEGQNG
jgi:hypothetical protein